MVILLYFLLVHVDVSTRGRTNRCQIQCFYVIGAIQVSRNAVGGGGGGVSFTGKSVTKTYGSTLLPLQCGGWGSNFQEKMHYVTLEWPDSSACHVHIDTLVIPGATSVQVKRAFVFPDAIGVHDKVAITNLQCKILDCLHKYTCKAYPSESKRHARMLLRLPTLRTVSAKAAECFLSMSLDGSVKMNALVLEMMS